MSEQQDHASPSSWRDVYSLVQDVERRLTDRIDTASGAALLSQRDHEGRIRALESQNFGERERRAGQVSLLTNGHRVLAALIIVSNAALGIWVATHP